MVVPLIGSMLKIPVGVGALGVTVGTSVDLLLGCFLPKTK